MSLETRLNYILKTGLLKKLEPQKINILSIGVEAPGELLAVANYFNIEKTAITFQVTSSRSWMRQKVWV